MCGRLTLRTSPTAWFQLHFATFDSSSPSGPVDSVPPNALDAQVPRYNLAPTQNLAAVIQASTNASPTLTELRWGLIPSFTDDIRFGDKTINARSETAASKPAFRDSFRSRRCLILADGYYEWQSNSTGKQPYLFEANESRMFALAGLWATNDLIKLNSNATVGDNPLETCTVLTQPANLSVGQYHHRMPVVLEPESWNAWLDPSYSDIDALQSLITQPHENYFKATAVSRRVNKATLDDPRCIEPYTPESETPLFDFFEQ